MPTNPRVFLGYVPRGNSAALKITTSVQDRGPGISATSGSDNALEVDRNTSSVSTSNGDLFTTATVATSIYSLQGQHLPRTEAGLELRQTYAFWLHQGTNSPKTEGGAA